MDTFGALRVCFLAHSSNLFGAERILLELVSQLMRSEDLELLEEVAMAWPGKQHLCLAPSESPMAINGQVFCVGIRTTVTSNDDDR